jgi:DNA mismatch repair protein MutS
MILDVSIIRRSKNFTLYKVEMYDEYVEHYKNYSKLYGQQTAIFFQVGKFYEFYDILDPLTGEGQTTTKQITDLLAIKLTYRKATGLSPEGAVRDGLWAGVPTQSLHSFAMRLTSQGWTCVIVDESKDAKGKITRATARILSPGTHLETADGMESMFLATLWLVEGTWAKQQPPSFGASIVDLTTGETVSYEGQAVGRFDTWAADDLLQFFQVYPPRECVLYWNGAALSIPAENFIRSRLGLSGLLHRKLATTLDYVQREDILSRMFKPKTMLPLREYLHLNERPHVELSLTSLVRVVEEHFPSFTERLHIHTVWSPEDSVFLGNNVLTQINFLTAREEDGILGIFLKTHTAMGKRAMRKRLLYPIRCVTTLQGRLDEITSIYEMSKEQKHTLHSLLQKVSDISRLHRKIQTYKITAADVLLLEQTYSYALKLAALVINTPLALPDIALQTYIDQFKQHFDIEKASRVDDDLFFLPDAKAPQTASAEQGLATLKGEVTTIVETIRGWAGLSETALRVESRDTLLYAITGSKTTMNTIKKTKGQPPYNLTITEKKSGANLDLPELHRIHTDVSSLRTTLQEAFDKELPPICQSLVDTYLDIWHTLEEWLARLDVTATLQRISEARGFTRPVLEEGEQGSLQLEGLRHPLIEAQQTRLEYVKHNVALSGQGWLLYGMNASGKSSLMKSVGIAVVLAQCGSYVPAVSMRLVPYASIFTRILNHDNLWAGLSSFAVEMTELREILLKADARSLVLGDEVCSGTESVSATSLVASALTWLAGRKSSFLFATHLHGLLSIKEVQTCTALQVWHLRVKYEPATGVLVYDRTLQKGAGSSMYGLEVARALSLPTDFLEVAQRFRHELLGTQGDETAPTSAWNAHVKRKVCELCQCAFVAEIEIHHIQPRQDALVTGHFADGTHQNHLRNLIAVCQSCHDKHHAGILTIGSVKQTSDGPVREVSIVEPRAVKSKWTTVQMETILKILREKPTVAISRILFELEEYHSIKISSATLQKIRKTGAVN